MKKKRKEKKKERGEGKEEKRKKAMVAVADPGEAPPPPAPLIFRPNLGPKGQKKIAIRSIILSLTSLLESVYEII